MNSTPSAHTVKSVWSGGLAPFAIRSSKLLMWFFIIGDALLFGGLLAGYGFARLSSPSWPDQAAVFHLSFLTAMTFVLISSSATMASAVAAAREKDWHKVVLFLLLTALGGLTFLGMQAYEWLTVIGEGARLWTNPWGVPQFSAYFFLITGFHGSHVLTGVIILLVAAIRSALRYASDDGIELAGLYWHFVDLVWVFIFTLFYLI